MLMAKAYFISIVWSCYKFLTMRAEGNRDLRLYKEHQDAHQKIKFFFSAVLERDNCISGIVDGQNLLEIPSSMCSPGSDLPDYATAMTDPRFAKKPIYPVPPPPYAAVVDVASESEASESEAVNVALSPESPKP